MLLIIMNKIPIKIILPGGGVKCSYQVGFMDALLSNDDFFNKYEIVEINGSSGGAIVGSYAATGQIDKLKDIIIKYEKLSDIFEPWFFIQHINKLPVIHFIMKFINLLMAITKKSLLNPYKFYKSIDLLNENMLKGCNNSKIIGLDKFNCVVTNLTDQKIEYINGTNKLIKDYIKASSTLWMLCPPYKINNKEYMDGGLCELYPMGHDKTFPNATFNSNEVIDSLDINPTHEDENCKYIIVNPQDGKPTKHSSKDIFYYLNSIINVTHHQLSYHRILHHDMLKNKNIKNYVIPGNIFSGNIDINNSKIRRAIAMGELDGYRCLEDLGCKKNVVFPDIYKK